MRTTTATPASGSQSCQSFRSSFNACLFRCGLILRGDDGISERADSADADFDNIAGGERAHTRGRAGSDHVTRLKRHHLRDEADYSINGKDHFRRVSRLFPDSIHVGFDADAGGIDLGFEDGSEGAESVEAFAAGELDIEFLQVAGGVVVEAGVAEDVGGETFICVQMITAAGGDDGEPGLVGHAVRDPWVDDWLFG